MLNELDELVLSIEGEIMEQGYDVDKVLSVNHILCDADMLTFAMRFLLSNVYEAMIEGKADEPEY